MRYKLCFNEYLTGRNCFGKKSCESCKVFLATSIQKVADIKCCEKSFSKKLRALNVAKIHFPKKAVRDKCRDEQF